MTSPDHDASPLLSDKHIFLGCFIVFSAAAIRHGLIKLQQQQQQGPNFYGGFAHLQESAGLISGTTDHSTAPTRQT